jgi:hypothetical protein
MAEDGGSKLLVSFAAHPGHGEVVAGERLFMRTGFFGSEDSQSKPAIPSSWRGVGVVARRGLMTDDQLREWIFAWSGRYPVEYDDVLIPLRGRAAFTMEEIDVILYWQLRSTPSYLTKARHNLKSAPECRILDIVARAIACSDDLGAYLLLADLTGVQHAIGSAILATADPDRFTVYDQRAKRSLKALELLQNSPCKGEWLNYVHSCRDIARRTRTPLRTIDRALFMANGRATLPR